MPVDIAKSDILFHATSFYSAWKILRDRQLIASAFGTMSEINNVNKPFYISFAREIYTNFSSPFIRLGGVILEIDARTLGNMYTLSKVNYWGGDRKTNNEAEDRLHSANNRVALPLDQVRKVHIWYTDKHPPNVYLFNLVVLCMREGLKIIPHKIKSLKVTDLKTFLEFVKERTITEPDPKQSKGSVQRISAYARLIKGVDLETDKMAADAVKKLTWEKYNDSVTNVMTDLHMARNTQVVSDLIKEMRIRRIKDVPDLITYIAQKYEN